MALSKRRIIGLSDGLTVPFALTAGLSSIGSSRLVVTGGLAELCAGAISMGVGGFCQQPSLSPDWPRANRLSGVPSRAESLSLPSAANPGQSQALLCGGDGARDSRHPRSAGREREPLPPARGRPPPGRDGLRRRPRGRDRVGAIVCCGGEEPSVAAMAATSRPGRGWRQGLERYGLDGVLAQVWRRHGWVALPSVVPRAFADVEQRKCPSPGCTSPHSPSASRTLSEASSPSSPT